MKQDSAYDWAHQKSPMPSACNSLDPGPTPRKKPEACPPRPLQNISPYSHSPKPSPPQESPSLLSGPRHPNHLNRTQRQAQQHTHKCDVSQVLLSLPP